MIAFLNGIVAGKSEGSAFIDVQGVGFEVAMALQALSELPPTGEAVLIHTYMQVREDGMYLYGFLSPEEKRFFEQLITVSGVGPKVALSALSSYSPIRFAELIAAQDIAAIQKVPGIGKKMASRIVLELKGSLDDLAGSLFEGSAGSMDAAVAEAREALLSMGFTSDESDLALKGAPEGADEGSLLQYALKKLGS